MLGNETHSGTPGEEAHQDGPFAPQSYHLPQTRLDAYASFAMTLVFEKAGSVVIEMMVEEAEQPKAQ